MTSCLMPLGNAHGKHIVTIEGLNRPDPTPIQNAMMEHGATQCGFCTVGFVVSLVGYALGADDADESKAVAAVDGNICRCTGYKSIERAAHQIAQELNADAPTTPGELAARGYLPDYFREIPGRLLRLSHSLTQPTGSGRPVGGGTDLYVQRPEEMTAQTPPLVLNDPELQRIELIDDRIVVGAAATVTDIAESAVFQDHFPVLPKWIRLVSSTPIRNMATLAGNFVNASPIGDMTIAFLALGAELATAGGAQPRTLPLRTFYRGYKDIDLTDDETLRSVSFPKPCAGEMFNFEKVCKRTHLDIASVNSAARIRMENDVITAACIAAGGVGPIPMVLTEASALLIGRPLTQETFVTAAEAAMDEISPISDARGAADYKRLLLKQLIFAHYLSFSQHPAEVRV